MEDHVHHTSEQKIKRIEIAKQIALKMVNKHYYKAIGVIAYNLGVNRMKAEEYLQTLKDMDMITVKNNVILEGNSDKTPEKRTKTIKIVIPD